MVLSGKYDTQLSLGSATETIITHPHSLSVPRESIVPYFPSNCSSICIPSPDPIAGVKLSLYMIIAVMAFYEVRYLVKALTAIRLIHGANYLQFHTCQSQFKMEG